MNIIKAFLRYQSVRFPLHILIFTTSATVVCSAAIIHYETSIWKISLALIAAMSFLFHIRVMDEFRDFNDDARHSPDSPLHAGIISRGQLAILDIVGIAVFLIISIFEGTPTLFFAAILLIFSFFARNDFFLRERLIKRKILYHLVNSPQMIFLQLLIFSIYINSLNFTLIMWLSTAFLYLNIFVLELVRKINIRELAPTDTYNKFMGLRAALLFTITLTLLSYFCFIIIILSISAKPQLYIFFSLPVILSEFLAFSFFIKKKDNRWQSIFMWGILVHYIVLNLLVCLSVIE